MTGAIWGLCKAIRWTEQPAWGVVSSRTKAVDPPLSFTYLCVKQPHVIPGGILTAMRGRARARGDAKSAVPHCIVAASFTPAQMRCDGKNSRACRKVQSHTAYVAVSCTPVRMRCRTDVVGCLPASPGAPHRTRGLHHISERRITSLAVCIIIARRRCRSAASRAVCIAWSPPGLDAELGAPTIRLPRCIVPLRSCGGARRGRGMRQKREGPRPSPAGPFLLVAALSTACNQGTTRQGRSSSWSQRRSKACP